MYEFNFFCYLCIVGGVCVEICVCCFGGVKRTRKDKVFVKPVVKKQIVDHVTGNKIPRSFVFCRGKLPGALKQLQLDLRKLMLPHTALNLKVCSYLTFFFFLFFCLSVCLFVWIFNWMSINHFLCLEQFNFYVFF